MTQPDERNHPLHPERLARDADELDVERDLLEAARRASRDAAVGPEDPGHYMTDEEWNWYGKSVVSALSASRARALPAGTTVLNWSAKFHGGSQTGTVQVNHSAETPLAVGYARSIGQYFVDGPAAGTSAHHMVDPKTVVNLLPPNVVGYHVGPNGNLGTIGWEQAGYAAFDRAKWTTDDGLAQIDVLASAMAEEAAGLKIPDRRLTNAQLAAWAANGRRLADGGRTSHNAVHLVLGGTTHTDPGPSYPWDLLDARITAYRNGEADDMFGDQDRADLKFIRQQIGGAVGAGQTSFEGTIEAVLSTVQTLVNKANAEGSQLSAIAAAIKDTSITLSDADKAEIAALVSGGSVDEILAAIADRLAAKPATP